MTVLIPDSFRAHLLVSFSAWDLCLSMILVIQPYLHQILQKLPDSRRQAPTQTAGSNTTRQIAL